MLYIKQMLLALVCAVAVTALTACGDSNQAQGPAPATSQANGARQQADAANPFFTESTLYLRYPDFDAIRIEHYRPAFEQGMAAQLAEIDAITDQAEPPTFDNTVVELERSGQLLTRVGNVFFSMTSAHTDEALSEIEAEISGKLAKHNDRILLNDKLFRRVQAVWAQRDQLGLDPESHRLVEETYTNFVRAGALLEIGQKQRLMAINARIAELQTAFDQNVLRESNANALVVNSAEELAGLAASEIEAARNAAQARELEGKYVLALLNTSGQPALAKLHNRDVRERLHKASLGRGSSGGEYDNRAVLTEIVKLRDERAGLLGYENHAAYVLENQTAGTTEAVNDLLGRLAPAAVRNARREAADLQAMIDAEGEDFTLASWDWAYYTEKVRKQRYDFDEAELMPYLELDNVLVNGVFFAAEKVFGLTFEERTGEFPVYQEDVRVWEVFDHDGSTLGLFLGDFYARPSKRGGAWMLAYVQQNHLLGHEPVVANHMNVTKPPAGEPTLLTWTQVGTLFHEFGHALHGLFSDVTYPSFSGTNVPRDYVEFPSQVNTMWATWPEVLENYAVHHETGEAMPRDMLDKVLATRTFNQGFVTTEYLAASLLDQAWHQAPAEALPDAEGLLDFEAEALRTAGVAMPEIPPRYRSTYFLHITGGYEAGYYSYIWSEVLDADSVEWFKNNGGMTRENGDHFRATLLSRGGAEDPMAQFRNFRGAEPDIAPLLARRGLD
ncbi:MAG: M3 family metallopeptidase [Xanthomonadales bacterium]|nr:M3 family metallopeptidase [Xanthomonadales bacterium]